MSRTSRPLFALAAALMAMLGAACATGKQSSAGLLRVEAQEALEQARKLQDAGQYAAAVPYAERALALTQSSFWKDHPETATCLDLLGDLHLTLGDHARAEHLLQRALALREAALGKEHPSSATSLTQLARLRLGQRRLTEALPLLERAFTLSEEHLREKAATFSETPLASILHRLHDEEERFYALAREHPDDLRVRLLALSAVLLRKGRSVEELSSTSRAIYRGLIDLADLETFERLRDLRTRFVMMSFAGPGELSPADYRRRLEDLARQGDAIEAALAMRSASLREFRGMPMPTQIVSWVKAALPRDSALIELVAYHDKPLGSPPEAPALHLPSELRYLALLLFADGRTRALDLGPAEPLDRAALRLHRALARSSDYQPAAQELYQLTFQRLAPLLGNTRRLFLSPDGQLALIPFAALHDGHHFLIDDFDITYLTSGRDLLPRPRSIIQPASVVVLADPDFGSPPAAASVKPAPTDRSALIDRIFSMLRSDALDQPWPPLPGTRKEAEAIQRLFPQTRLIQGRAATKEALLKLAPPGILHIATHGYFFEDATAPVNTRAVKSFGAVGATGPRQLPPEPLLRSGLVVAGAQAPAAQEGARRGKDSFVTALELAGLNLWGTQLVVLSACETGRGDIKLGQGVYGLRRALVMAGAETLVTSLWKVNDETTRELMERYYGHLMAGQGRGEALQAAMQELRQQHPHPYFWAPFIAIGRDEPLHGLTPLRSAQPAP